MEDRLFSEASLGNSVIFKSFNGNAEFNKRIIGAIKDSTVITQEYITEQILQIKRTNISPLVEDVLRAYEKGDITILYSNTKKVPSALPFFATKVQGKVKVFVFANNYGKISKATNGSGEKFLNITMKDLYALLEGALCAYTLIVYPQKAVRSLALMKLSCNIYTNMVLRILNKEYAISMDQDLYANVAYSIGKFFLTNVWGYNNENIIFSYAKSSIPTVMSSNELLIIDKMYDNANIENISDLITFISGLSPRLKGMNFRYFVQCFINTYKSTALFGLEVLPYFLFSIQATLLGSFIVNQPIISDITKNIKGMNNFYPELVKIIS